jgi:hypothetical protein
MFAIDFIAVVTMWQMRHADSLWEALFVQMILADDRAIRAHSRRQPSGELPKHLARGFPPAAISMSSRTCCKFDARACLGT